MIWAVIALLGALGAIARFVVDRAIMFRVATSAPVGTLVINLSGSLVLGLLVGLATRGVVTSNELLAFGDGFIGAFTTFSTLTFESLALVQSRRRLLGVANIVGTLVVGSMLALAGLGLARHIGSHGPGTRP